MPGTMTPADTLRTGSLLTIAALLALAAMHLLADVLVPFVLAAFGAMLLNPLVDALIRRYRWPRPVAVGATFLTGTLLLTSIIYAVASPAAGAAESLFEYGRSLEKSVANGLANLPFDLPPAWEAEAYTWASDFERSQLLPYIGAAGGGVLSMLSDAGLILVFLLFLLLGRGDRPVPAESTRGRIERRVQAYLAVTLAVSAATGLLVGFSLWILGVRLAWVFGAAAFVLNFIPVVGSALATLLPIPFILFGQELSTPVIVAAIGVPAAIQFVLGNILAPKLLGDALQLSPVAVMLGLILLGAIWGLPGMVLSTPLLSVFAIAVDRSAEGVPMLRPLGDWLAGRTARAA